jgi:hypothetical protein
MALNITIPYEETEPKQLMVENNCNNNIAESDKDEQILLKVKPQNL